jgi:hypothetical protein
MYELRTYNFIHPNQCQRLITKETSKCFCITWFDYTPENVELLRQRFCNHVSKRTNLITWYQIKYMCFSFETETTKDKTCIQAYVQFFKRITPSVVASIYNGSCVAMTNTTAMNNNRIRREKNNFEEFGYMQLISNIEKSYLPINYW